MVENTDTLYISFQNQYLTYRSESIVYRGENAVTDLNESY